MSRLSTSPTSARRSRTSARSNTNALSDSAAIQSARPSSQRDGRSQCARQAGSRRRHVAGGRYRLRRRRSFTRRWRRRWRANRHRAAEHPAGVGDFGVGIAAEPLAEHCDPGVVRVVVLCERFGALVAEPDRTRIGAGDGGERQSYRGCDASYGVTPSRRAARCIWPAPPRRAVSAGALAAVSMRYRSARRRRCAWRASRSSRRAPSDRRRVRLA